MVDYKFLFWWDDWSSNVFNSSSSSHPMLRQLFLQIGQLPRRYYYNLFNPPLDHTSRWIYSPSRPIDMGKWFNGRAHLRGGNTHLKCGIRWIGALQFPIWMFYNAVSTTWSNRCGFTVTENYTMKLLLGIRVRKMVGTILAWWTNHIAHLGNRSLRISRSEVSMTFFEKATCGQQRRILSTYITTTKSSIHRIWLKKSCWVDFTMRSLRSYSVFTLHSVASLGLHQTQVADSFMWEYKARKGNIISHIFRALNSHESSGNLPNQPRVIRCQHIGHHGRDRRHWIPNELKHLWLHHGIFENVCYPFLKIYSFVWHFGCCQFDLVSGFWRIVTPTLYCARSLLVAQSNPINISFSSAITQHNYGGRFYLLGINFSHLDHVGLILHVQLCHHFGRIGRSISKLYQIYGLHYKRWLCTSSGPIGIVVCSISDQQLRQFQHFPWYTLRLVPTFGTFEDSVTIIYERIRLAKMLDQLATQGSFVGFFRSRRSLLRVRHRQVELQVQLGS